MHFKRSANDFAGRLFAEKLALGRVVNLKHLLYPCFIRVNPWLISLFFRGTI
jgi:hypothetical protein